MVLANSIHSNLFYKFIISSYLKIHIENSNV